MEPAHLKRNEPDPSGRRTVTRRWLLRRGIAAGIAVPAAGALMTIARPKPGANPSPGASPAAASPVPAAAVTVKMTSILRFDPPAITIKVGDTVRWINVSPIPHTTTDDPRKNPVEQAHPEWTVLPKGAAPWDSGLLNQGQSFSHTFTVPGVYKYFCIPHILSGMRGTITVKR